MSMALAFVKAHDLIQFNSQSRNVFLFLKEFLSYHTFYPSALHVETVSISLLTLHLQVDQFASPAVSLPLYHYG